MCLAEGHANFWTHFKLQSEAPAHTHAAVGARRRRETHAALGLPEAAPGWRSWLELLAGKAEGMLIEESDLEKLPLL